MINDFEKVDRATFVEFMKFLIRQKAGKNLEDLEFVVYSTIQTAISAGIPQEILSNVVPELYKKLKAERDAATKLQ
ncbi:hypothetical protein [Paenibacillus larvae]|uniref:Uncharacterized protein n=2 Tax=root TaxID=1 RepID=A0A2I7SC28_9CAUD|nr:hypothetical protein [Paenibacillus larvae]YP_010080198.1 hypothetical protein KMC72_gp45 [Paenibacillus phage Dragolir]AUS03445.1 hypothetical protein DRAGOLIR_45 [Paenibacillus phage Dragolir]ETK27220.1 hypothetical protein ERIC1_1c06630 [Paenibacillus larvae subsp. larvae DSM 25719]MCY9563228.1 hypothetical protein [Paenibacillus larvae]MCY9569038.1 hypothetical protein [Paenibacillus larvae]MCY9571129.1 hypothetical protein [Paenibacillus larvae]